MKAGALSDDGIVKKLNDKTVPVYIDGTNKEDKTYLALKAKYGVGGIPCMVFMSPLGQELARIVGAHPKNPQYNLDRLNRAISASKPEDMNWVDTVTRAVKLGKDQTKPVIKYTVGKDGYSEDLKFVMRNLPSIKKIEKSFLWVEEQIEAEAKTGMNTGFDVQFIDPYTEKSSCIIVSDFASIAHQLSGHLESFNEQYKKKQKTSSDARSAEKHRTQHPTDADQQ